MLTGLKIANTNLNLTNADINHHLSVPGFPHSTSLEQLRLDKEKYENRISDLKTRLKDYESVHLPNIVAEDSNSDT